MQISKQVIYLDGNQGVAIKSFVCKLKRFWIYRDEIRELFQIKQHWIDQAITQINKVRLIINLISLRPVVLVLIIIVLLTCFDLF